ncbi:MAG: hypothetical protein HRF46_12785 [Acidobacteriota bacterium]|jgi:type IV pilus assembly protein PilP
MKHPITPLVMLVVAAVAAAQAPAGPQDQPIDTSTVERILRGEEAADAGGAFSYDPAGRRDPFRSLLAGRQREDLGDRPPGLRGMAVDEIKLQGIMRLPDGYVAMIQGTDNTSYLLQAGAVLWDGTVERIEPGRVIFKVQVADPQSLRPYREVVRTLQ